MNPKVVLSLWRARWDKTADTAFKRPYLQGKPNAWGRRLTHTGLWSLPAAVPITSLASLALLLWMLSIQFSQGGQLAFSLVFAGFAVYIRRYGGTLVTLTLLGMSLLMSARYLYWRFTSTLGSGFSSDFVLGFGLCVAEFHLWALSVLGFVHKVWPLQHASSRLPAEQDTWPTVDVYLPIQGCDLATILQRCSNAFALDWPREKLQVFLLDGEPRDAAMDLAASFGATYIGYVDKASDASVHVNQALSQTDGELVAIFDGNRSPEKNFLQMTAGWFVRDQSLGMLRTPQNPLGAEVVTSNPPLLPSMTSSISCAIVRRSMVVEFDDEKPGMTNLSEHIARKLHVLGFGSGYIGFNTNRIPSADIFRVDQQLSSTPQIWQQRFAALRSMLHFYLPIPRWVFFTAPLAYLLAGVHVIQTNPGLLAAYAVPHFLHGYIAKGRLGGSKRLALWADVRDTVLGWYMLLPTTFSVVRTEISQTLAAIRTGFKDQSREPFHWTLSLPYSIVLLLNLFGLVAGMANPQWPQGNASIDSTLYLPWCVCNVMLLAATLAVAEEGRHIRQQTRKLSRMPAMLQLPSGHTLSCETENFPETALSLLLPISMHIDNGSEVNVSIFCGLQEYGFPTRVVSLEGSVLSVRIDESALDRYQNVGAAILSRGPDWPGWLPGPNADHPLPKWLGKPIDSTWLKMKTLSEKLGNTIGRSWLGRWIQKRKIQT